MDIKATEGKKQKSIEVFCCYSHKDQSFLLELVTHLAPLQKEGMIILRADINMNAGAEWEKELDRYLNTAQIILLLVSPDFIASEYCYSIEMRRAMERHERNEAHVIPIILRPTAWQGTLFGKLLALPQDAIPVDNPHWHTSDYAFFAIVEGIKKTIETLEIKIPDTEFHSSNPGKEEITTSEQPQQENKVQQQKSLHHRQSLLRQKKRLEQPLPSQKERENLSPGKPVSHLGNSRPLAPIDQPLQQQIMPIEPVFQEEGIPSLSKEPINEKDVNSSSNSKYFPLPRARATRLLGEIRASEQFFDETLDSDSQYLLSSSIRRSRKPDNSLEYTGSPMTYYKRYQIQ